MKPNDPIEIQRQVHLGQVLGEGGMGRVIEGFAPDLGQHLAIKQLRAEWMEDAEVRSRFEKEATLMASIDHPGVLPVYGIGLDDERHLFYAMKKVEGQTLGQLIADTKEPVASVTRRARLTAVLLDVCETVAAAHDKGIVHRDLKPDNILIDRANSVYVIDWGLAKHTGKPGASPTAERTLPGKIMGTPGYMAPEQADGRSARAGAEADVFALGVIFYEILTGIRPFAAGDDRAEMLGTIHQEPKSPKQANWLIPRDLNAICLKALQKDPPKRYPNAGSLASDLRAHLEGRAVSAIRPNLTGRIRYAARRRPMRAVIISSTLIALGLLALFIASQRWVDHRLADKAMHRLATIESEVAEIESEDRDLRLKLANPKIPESERTQTTQQLKINESRWILAQFEAYRLLNSVAELRFIKSDVQVTHKARQRLISTIRNSIDRGNPTLGLAIIATYLERADEGTLASPLSAAERATLQKLAAAARNPN